MMQSEQKDMGEFGIGQPVPREEDPYLVRGAGRYVDDVQVERADARLCAALAAWPCPHRRRSRPTPPRRCPASSWCSPARTRRCASSAPSARMTPRKRRDGSPAFASPQPFLARERVRYLGDPVAFVVAETLEQAKDAAEAIEVEYETLPAVATTEEAIEPGAVAVWEGCPDNQAFTHTAGDAAAVAKMFAAAAHVIKHRMVINRLTTNSMEPRGCIAEYALARPAHHAALHRAGPAHDPPHHRDGSVQGGRDAVPRDRRKRRRRLRHEGRALSGIRPGGARGAPHRPAGEMDCRAQRGIQSDEHCRDNVTEAELALDKDGRFLALAVRNYANIGAYYNSDRNAGPPTNNIGVLAGTYVIPAIHSEVTAVLTNTMMTGPYRGAGRPEAAYVVETMVDLAARKLGIDPRRAAPPQHDPGRRDALQDGADLHL